MKYFPLFSMIIFLFSCQPKKAETEVESQVRVQKGELSRLKWIEGNWVGEYQGKPFYETYKMESDSSIAITSYIHVGTDSADQETSYLMWQDSAYYLGSQKNYIVISIDDKEIAMVPHNRATNEIVWTYQSDSTWTALLSGIADTLHYTMKRVHSMDSILLKTE